jgi:hypothetical protein
MRLIGFWCVVLAALVVFASTAQAQEFGISDWRAQVYDSDATTEAQETDANVFNQAGGHPFIGVTDFALAGTTPPTSDNVENLRVDVPAGLVPNPDLTPRCSDAQMELSLCPSASQIGTEDLTLELRSIPGVEATLHLPLYNMEIEDDQISRFAFNPADASGVPGTGLLLSALGLHQADIVGGVRDSADIANPPGHDAFQYPVDHGLFFTINDIPQTTSVVQSKLTFWGIPGEPAHAPLGVPLSFTPTSTIGQACITGIPDAALTLLGIPLGLPTCTHRPDVGPLPDPDLPFLSNPTACTGAKLASRLFVDGNLPEEPGPTDSAVDLTPTIDGREGASGCEQVPFAADVNVEPDTSQPDAPTGPTVGITVSQNGLHDKDVLATSHVRDVSVTLPPGMTLNPSVANGLVACTDAQLAFQAGVPGGDACPDASRIGTVNVRTPLLPPLPGQPAGGPDQVGSAYVGQPLPGDMYRLFLTIEGRGVSIRLKGSVRPDPNTGQLTATFPNNPELPFDDLSVDFRGGPLAPLANPLDCGPKTGTATLTPWSGTAPLSATSDPFSIADASCPAAFRVGFGASTVSPGSGQFSPLRALITRGDRNQFLARIVRIDAPPGLGAKIKGVEQCAAAAAATGACPAASRIGTATTTAGAGSRPYLLSGPVYLTEGYKGAPFGMAVVIRAIAGPYDLGTVVVRQSLWVDPEDASVTVVSDALPQILEGVPTRLRSVDVTLDRPGFTYNPTSCGTKEVGGRFHSTLGTVADPNASLTFAGCEQLGFTPRMRMRLAGARQLREGRHPSLRVRVTQPPTQANIASAVVRLPKSLALDPENAQAVCGFEAGLRADCPRNTRIGRATAISPVLNERLRGPVYFVQGIRVDPNTGNRIRTLPTLLVKLNGEVRINLRGTTEVRRGALVSLFSSVPDAPVSRFDIRLKGGKGGVLAATGRPKICGRRQIGIAKVLGHNGKRSAQRRIRMGKARPCKQLRRLQLRAKRRRAAKRRSSASASVFEAAPKAL